MATSAVDANTATSAIPVGMAQANSEINNAMQQITNITNANNAWSNMQAMEQRNWQEEQNQKAMTFNAAEAAKSRDWQEYMSNTAHQREVADLKAAGLNPVLSAMGGSGAAVTSGATASGVTSSGAKGDTDTSGAAAMVSLLGQVLNQQTALANTAMSAQTQLAVADKYNSMSQIVAELNKSAALGAAATSAAASRYASDISRQNTLTQAETSKYASDISRQNTLTQAETSKYASDVSRSNNLTSTLGNLGSTVISGVNNILNTLVGGSVSSGLQQSQQQHEKEMQGTGTFWSTVKDLGGSIIDAIF